MQEHMISVDGLSINGRNLSLTCQTHGQLSCVVEACCQANRPLDCVLCFVVAVFVFTAWFVYEEVITSTQALFLSFIIAVLLYIKFSYFDVVKESVFVIKNLGVQLCTKYKSGRQETQFVDRKYIVDVIINEAITMHKVIFYLALLSRIPKGGQSEDELQLIPLFTSSCPRLDTLKAAYKTIRDILISEKDERTDSKLKPRKVS